MATRMTERENILEKIRKLLRMKHGGTPDEIATALRLAQELADKHDIDLNSVNPDDAMREKPITHTDETCGRRVSWESKYSGLVCQQFFKVRVFQSVNDLGTKYVMRFVGEAWDIEIAIYVYRFLCGHFRREWNYNSGRCRNRRAFMWGMYIGLCDKLASRLPDVENKFALVKSDRALAYIKDNFGDLSSTSAKPDDDATKARLLGLMAGRNTEIRGGVKHHGVDREELMPTAGTKLLA